MLLAATRTRQRRRGYRHRRAHRLSASLRARRTGRRTAQSRPLCPGKASSGLASTSRHRPPVPAPTYRRRASATRSDRDAHPRRQSLTGCGQVDAMDRTTWMPWTRPRGVVDKTTWCRGQDHVVSWTGSRGAVDKTTWMPWTRPRGVVDKTTWMPWTRPRGVVDKTTWMPWTGPRGCLDVTRWMRRAVPCVSARRGSLACRGRRSP